MFRHNLCFSHILSKTLSLNSYIYINGTVMTFTSNDDFKNLSYIKQQAYTNSIDTVVIDKDVTTITNLDELNFIVNVEIKNNLQTIPKYAFFRCLNLKTVKMPATVKEIGLSAFAESGIETIDLSNVETIGVEAFYECLYLKNVNIGKAKLLATSAFARSGVTSLIVPATVGYIPDFLCQDCIGLKTVTCSGPLSTVGIMAFSGCSALESFSFSKITCIGAQSFENTKITSFNFENVGDIQNRAFQFTCLEEVVLTQPRTIFTEVFGNCRHLKKATLKNQNLKLATYLFNGCSSLEIIDIQDDLNTIPLMFAMDCISLKTFNAQNIYVVSFHAFTNCHSLESFDFSKCNTVQGYAFQGCYKLKATLPTKSVFHYIEQFGFAYCENIDVESEINVWEVKDYAFLGCKSIKKVQYNTGTDHAGVFMGCTGLESISFKDTCQNFGDSFCFGCTSLTSIKFGANANTIRTNSFARIGAADVDFVNIQWIGDYAFMDSNIKSIKITHAGPGIGKFAFANCKNLETVQIDDLWNTEDITQFENSTNIKTFNAKRNGNLVINQNGIILSNDTTTLLAVIGSYSKNTITLPYSVKKFYKGALNMNDKITELVFETVPKYGAQVSQSYFIQSLKYEIKYYSDPASDYTDNSLNEFPEGMFANCYALTTVNIVTDIKSIGNNCFSNCVKLTTVTLPNGCTVLGQGAFMNCVSLKSINIDKVVTIEENCFSGCVLLQDVKLGNPLQTIGDAAFKGTALTIVKLPAGVTSLGVSAFEDTKNLSYVVLNGLLTSLPSFLFKNSNISSLNIPANIVDVASDCFIGARYLNLTVADNHNHLRASESCLYNYLTSELITTYGQINATFFLPSFIKILNAETVNPIFMRNKYQNSVNRYGSPVIVLHKDVLHVDPNAFKYDKLLYTVCYFSEVYHPKEAVPNKYLQNVYIHDNYHYPDFLFGQDQIKRGCDLTIPDELNWTETNSSSGGGGGGGGDDDKHKITKAEVAFAVTGSIMLITIIALAIVIFVMSRKPGIKYERLLSSNIISENNNMGLET